MEHVTTGHQGQTTSNSGQDDGGREERVEERHDGGEYTEHGHDRALKTDEVPIHEVDAVTRLSAHW